MLVSVLILADVKARDRSLDGAVGGHGGNGESPGNGPRRGSKRTFKLSLTIVGQTSRESRLFFTDLGTRHPCQCSIANCHALNSGKSHNGRRWMPPQPLSFIIQARWMLHPQQQEC